MAAFMNLSHESSLLLSKRFRRSAVIGPQAARRPPIHPPPTGSRSFLLKSGRGRKAAGGAACHAAAPRGEPGEGETPPPALLSQSR